MEGRDIGTVVFPDAELKVFMTASIEVRVKRRYDEMQAKGLHVSVDDVKENVLSRDYEDTHRNGAGHNRQLSCTLRIQLSQTKRA